MKNSDSKRQRFTINGIVQGVGFRPFIYTIALDLGIKGWVKNNPEGVVIEAESTAETLAKFADLIKEKKPANAVIDSFIVEDIEAQGAQVFEIILSGVAGGVTTSILPDMGICDDCKREMLDKNNRRHRYPFINCTNCGPRWSIIKSLPYDRPNTSMAEFIMCEDCAAEYKNPLDRRFHAQPVACDKCGPQIELKDNKGNSIAMKEDALLRCVKAIRAEKIIALKGLSGFHIILDAKSDVAIARLRSVKMRATKPFALMYPSIDEIEKDCFVSDIERDILTSQQAPIVLLKHKSPDRISDLVAPNNPYLGVMLPYTPLHILLMNELGFPIVATSGNRASEPVCMDDNEALSDLSDMVDLFLIHNRPIVQRADDSIVKIIGGRACVLRRGRGYSPSPFIMPYKTEEPILAAGAHLKNTVALAIENKLIISPHIADLETLKAISSNKETLLHLSHLYKVKPQVITCDKHPEYGSTQGAKQGYKTAIEVQHHYAHALACMLDNGIEGECTAVVWDGTGLGDDGTIWGGEFLKITGDGYERALHFKTFKLAGGNAAIKEPRRIAFGILHEMGMGQDCNFAFSIDEEKLLKTAFDKNINCVDTSSAGRLFDAAASILGIAHKSSFEGEAAMALEFAAESPDTAAYPFSINNGVIDWRDMIKNIIKDKETGENIKTIAKRFHNTMAEIIVSAAKAIGEKRVLLTGGCFQNKILTETAINRLKAEGFEPYWHRQIPTNDGGLAAGQIIAMLRSK